MNFFALQGWYDGVQPLVDSVKAFILTTVTGDPCDRSDSSSTLVLRVLTAAQLQLGRSLFMNAPSAVVVSDEHQMCIEQRSNRLSYWENGHL